MLPVALYIGLPELVGPASVGHGGHQERPGRHRHGPQRVIPRETDPDAIGVFPRIMRARERFRAPGLYCPGTVTKTTDKPMVSDVAIPAASGGRRRVKGPDLGRGFRFRARGMVNDDPSDGAHSRAIARGSRVGYSRAWRFPAMLNAETLLGMRLSGLTLIADLGAAVRALGGFIARSETVSTSYGSLAATPVGVKGVAQVFKLVSPTQLTQAKFRMLARVPWTLTTQSAGTPTGRVDGTLSINGVVQATANGAARSLSAANGTKYQELLAFDLPSAVILVPGDVITVGFQMEIIDATGGTTFTATLRHDPATLDDQLVLEFQGMEGVV